MAKDRTGRFRKRDIAYATSLIRRVCEIAGQRNLIEDVRHEFKKNGLVRAVKQHDDDAIFNWLAEAISFQGISDTIAAGYIEQHGCIEAWDIRQGQLRSNLCLKLTSYWHFENCGYRKTDFTCKVPGIIRSCPLPGHDLRNGILNRAAYSLYFFMRDVAKGDFVAWIDGVLARADLPDTEARPQRLRDAVVAPLKHVFGISDKILNMTLASLLLGGDASRERWISAGGAMIAIDTLVHNWLHRTGILGRLAADHLYGNQCYGPRGCAAIIKAVATDIDAKTFNADFPNVFPRFVQKAIWAFCAATQIGRCNGSRIDDRDRCKDSDCPLCRSCARIALNPPAIAHEGMPTV